jgi:hypothetical protein
MALSRSTVFLLLLPCPAVAYLAASLGDVNASSQCLSSPEAVRQEYPDSWAAWTTHAPNHKGTKCWFPAMRENHSRHIETLLRNSAEAQAKAAQAKAALAKEAPTKEAQARNPAEHPQAERANNRPTEAQLGSAKMNELGWSFRSRTAKVGSARIFDEFAEVESSFNDRFAAALEVTSVRQPSIIQRMMDPVGAIP